MRFLKSKIVWLVVAAIVLIGAGFYFGSSEYRQILWDAAKSGKWFVPVLLLAALVDSVNPCAISVLLLTIAFLFSMGAARRRVIKVGGAYIVGIFVVYILIGLGVLQALQFLNVPHAIAKFGALIMILFGVVELLGELFPTFPIKLKIPQSAHGTLARFMERGSVPTAFVMGLLLGMYEFPCTGGPYLFVLGMLHDKATFGQGFSYLVLYNLIFVLPLLVILGIASDQALLQRAEAWKKGNTALSRWGMGIVMILLGGVILLF